MYDLLSKLYQLLSALYPLHCMITQALPATLCTLRSTLYDLTKLYQLLFALYTLRCKIYPSFTSYSLHSTLYALRSTQALPATLCTQRFTLYSLSTTCYPLHSIPALNALHYDLPSKLYQQLASIYALRTTICPPGTCACKVLVLQLTFFL